MNRLFVDNLTVLDFSFFHPQRGVVGESWIVDVELTGELNDEGMLFDFGHVKKLLKQALDNGLDHTLAIPMKLNGLSKSDLNLDEDTQIQYHNIHGELAFQYIGPKESIFLVDADRVSIEAVLPLLEHHLNTLVPSNVSSVKLNLRTEEIPGAFYHYSHGLKKHQGDCQRICHGHRSRIEIFRNNQRDFETEAHWATRFSDIYLITEEDKLPSEHKNLQHVGYDAEQGRFEVWLNPAQCYSMDSDTTVELIASHIAEHIKGEEPDATWQIKAFEGLQKGAIAE